MRAALQIIFLFFLANTASFAQSSWSALLPSQFPTNASGQIHGISRVSQLKFHPSDPNKMYAISARGGLFITSDGGTNWSVTPGTDFMPTARLASVCIDFTNDQIIYLGTGDHDYYYTGIGVWKSSDGGNTFAASGLTGRLIVEMIMDPNNQNIIVAATDAGIYKTIDAGQTWTLKSAVRRFDDLKLKANSATRTMFAATADSAFFRSTNFGDTWTQINSGLILPSGVTNGNGVRLAVTPADSNVVYLAMVANGGMIYKSTDGGTTFTAKKTSSSPYISYYTNSSASSGQGDYNHGLGADRTNPNILWYVAHCVWKSTDGGVNWVQQTNWWATVHTDMHQIEESPYNSTQLYNMNDGGVWLSTNGGTSWNPKSDGIAGYEIYHGNCSPTNRDIVSIGTQDNGELYANATGWFTNRGGDWSSQCTFDYRPGSSMVYYHNSNKRRLVTGSSVTYGLPAQVTVLQDVAFQRSNPDLAFVGDTIIVRTTNLTATTPTWTQISNLSKKIMAMHSSFADPNRLYVITSDAKIYVSTNALSATPTFTFYTVPNSTSSAASITSIKNSPNTLYITCNTKVYRSIDNGINWTNITLNLPSVNHVRILADEYYSTAELVFIASDNTVYYKIASLPNWIIFNQNLPSRTSVKDLSIFNDSTANTILRVATYGRGIWESPISGVRTVSSNFTANNTAPCIGGTVQFNDISTGNPTSWTWSFPGGTPSTSSLQNPIITYNIAGTYSVTLTSGNANGTNSQTKTDYITVNSYAAAGVSIAASPGATICIGSNVIFTATPSNGGSLPSYQWKVDGANVGTNSSTYSSTSLASGNLVTCILTSNANCVSGGPATSNIITMTVNPSVTASVNITASPSTTICSGTNVTFTAVPTNGGTSPVYQWKRNGTNVGTNSPSYSVSTLVNGNQVTCVLTSYATCVIGSPATSNSISMIVNPSITAAVGITASPATTVCAGTTVTFTANPTNGGTSPNYQWKQNGINIGTNSPAYSSNSIVSLSLFKCEMISNASCVTNATATSNTIRITVNPNLTAGVSISSNPDTVCASSTNSFTAIPINGGTIPSYQWQVNGTNAGTNSTLYSTNLLLDGNQVKCVMSSNANCVSGSPATSNILTAINCQSIVSLKLFIEGYYLGSSTMRAVADPVNYPATCDTVSVSLAQSNSPYSLFGTVKGTISTSGEGSFTFSSVPSSNYYIVVGHRNALETWSSTAIPSAPVMIYDFSTAASQAFGSNQKNLGDGNFAIISGDINQEDVIDMNDNLLLEQSIQNLESGYISGDLNGDGVAEATDFSLLENNIGLFVTQRP